jgi:hypothetical protein
MTSLIDQQRPEHPDLKCSNYLYAFWKLAVSLAADMNCPTRWCYVLSWYLEQEYSDNVRRQTGFHIYLQGHFPLHIFRRLFGATKATSISNAFPVSIDIAV